MTLLLLKFCAVSLAASYMAILRFLQSKRLVMIVIEKTLSHDAASGSEIMPCNKINKLLVVYRLVCNVMTPIIRLCKRW